MQELLKKRTPIFYDLHGLKTVHLWKSFLFIFTLSGTNKRESVLFLHKWLEISSIGIIYDTCNINELVLAIKCHSSVKSQFDRFNWWSFKDIFTKWFNFNSSNCCDFLIFLPMIWETLILIKVQGANPNQCDPFRSKTQKAISWSFLVQISKFLFEQKRHTIFHLNLTCWLSNIHRFAIKGGSPQPKYIITPCHTD